MGAWDEVVKDSRTRLGERDDCLSDEQVAEVMSWPNAILAANEVVEAAKRISNALPNRPLIRFGEMELYYSLVKLRDALKKLEEG